MFRGDKRGKATSMARMRQERVRVPLTEEKDWWVKALLVIEPGKRRRGESLYSPT